MQSSRVAATMLIGFELCGPNCYIRAKLTHATLHVNI